MIGRLIERAIKGSIVGGFGVGREMVEMFHLQFTDDIIFFMAGNIMFIKIS